ncbi:MAG: PilW family protein [Rhodocyclaceae bacterium]|nr:PilW family protein [Rhodocyclaceae bacterium]
MRTGTRECGFSLIEMMISITIGLMIIAALVGVLVGSSRSSKTNERTSELQGNGRYALDYLKRELRQAGYRGYSWAEPSTPTTTIAVTNECLDGGAANAFVQNIRQGIWGANDNNPYTANCLPAASRLRGDVLVTRRVANAPLTGNTLNNTLYFRSSYAAGEVFLGTGAAALTGAPAITGTPLADFALQEHVYYIGNGGDNGTDTTVPALRRIALKGSGDICNGATVTAATMCDEMVVSGIEHMQVHYGIATTDLNTRYYNAGDTPDLTGASTLSSQNGWDNVNSVRIWLLARNAKIENGYTNTSSYTMGDITYPTQNDGFRRQLFTAVIQLRN